MDFTLLEGYDHFGYSDFEGRVHWFSRSTDADDLLLLAMERKELFEIEALEDTDVNDSDCLPLLEALIPTKRGIVGAKFFRAAL